MDSALRTSCLVFMQFLSASDQPDPQSSRSYLTGAGLLLTIRPLRSFSSQPLLDGAVVVGGATVIDVPGVGCGNVVLVVVLGVLAGVWVAVVVGEFFAVVVLISDAAVVAIISPSSSLLFSFGESSVFSELVVMSELAAVSSESATMTEVLAALAVSDVLVSF